MKTYLNLLALLLLLHSSACQRDQQKAFLKGTYTHSVRGEFSTADDTLVVEAAENNNFLIHRRTGFNVINDGKFGKRQHEKEEWNAVYDESTKTLMETRKGRLITIHPDSGYLKVGKRIYIKN